MNVWDTTLINLSKGYKKLQAFAAVFSERLKAEVAIIRLRMQIDAAARRIDEVHRMLGKKMLEMREREQLPRTMDLFFKQEEIADLLKKLDDLRRDLEQLQEELAVEQGAGKIPAGKPEDEA